MRAPSWFAPQELASQPRVSLDPTNSAQRPAAKAASAPPQVVTDSALLPWPQAAGANPAPSCSQAESAVPRLHRSLPRPDGRPQDRAAPSQDAPEWRASVPGWYAPPCGPPL